MKGNAETGNEIPIGNEVGYESSSLVWASFYFLFDYDKDGRWLSRSLAGQEMTGSVFQEEIDATSSGMGSGEVV